MSKKRKPMSELPTMQRLKPGMEVTISADESIEPTDKTQCELVSTTVTVPFVVSPPKAAGHQDEAHRIDMGSLTKERMRKVKAMRRGYIASDTRMEGGYEVKTNRDALFCLLDHLDI